MSHGKPSALMMIALLLAMIAAEGCGSDSDRVAQIALEASQRQAAQDQEMAKLNQTVAEGTRQMTAERGEANRQLLAMEQNLQTQRDDLDAERRSMGAARRRESLLAPVLTTIGALIVCALPLVLCWYLLHGLGAESSETEVTGMLTEQLLLRDDPLPLGHSPLAELPGPDPEKLEGS